MGEKKKRTEERKKARALRGNKTRKEKIKLGQEDSNEKIGRRRSLGRRTEKSMVKEGRNKGEGVGRDNEGRAEARKNDDEPTKQSRRNYIVLGPWFPGRSRENKWPEKEEGKDKILDEGL